MLTPVGYAVYITANISGGHLNPAVTLATIVTGHISFLKGLAYIFVQICGACFGMLMVVRSLTPFAGCLQYYSWMHFPAAVYYLAAV